MLPCCATNHTLPARVLVLITAAAVLAMLVEVETATALVSFGTLIALWMVCNAQLFRRYVPDTQLSITRCGAQPCVPQTAASRQASSLGKRRNISSSPLAI